MITHLKIKVLYSVCFLAVSAVSVKLCFTLVCLFLGTNANRLYAGSRLKSVLLLQHGKCVCARLLIVLCVEASALGFLLSR